MSVTLFSIWSHGGDKVDVSWLAFFFFFFKEKIHNLNL